MLRVSYDGKVDEFDLDKVDYDINVDPDDFIRLHVKDKKTEEVKLCLSLRRDVAIKIAR